MGGLMTISFTEGFLSGVGIMESSPTIALIFCGSLFFAGLPTLRCRVICIGTDQIRDRFERTTRASVSFGLRQLSKR